MNSTQLEAALIAQRDTLNRLNALTPALQATRDSKAAAADIAGQQAALPQGALDVGFAASVGMIANYEYNEADIALREHLAVVEQTRAGVESLRLRLGAVVLAEGQG